MYTNTYDLLIVDANSLIYRTYFASARTDLSVQGQSVGATYGFFNILLKTLQSYKFAYVAFCWDVAKHTFRNEIYADYKANRESMPEELASQIPLVRNSLQLANFCQLGWEGYEADDLIGSLSKQAKETGLETLVLSSDKDDLQLVNEHVSILMPKGSGVYELWDQERLFSEYAVDGTGWLHMKALMGDTSDNIPGVKGIGIKGAANLIAKYKTISNLEEHLSELTKSQQKKISEDRANMHLSFELSKIKCDLQVINDWSLLKNPSYKQVALANILSSLEFKSLLNRYDLFNYASKNYNLRALCTKNLLVKREEQAIFKWQNELTDDFFLTEPEKQVNSLEWQQTENEPDNNLIVPASKLLREYLILNYPYILDYGSSEREIILHLLEKLKQAASTVSSYFSLLPDMKAAFKDEQAWHIVRIQSLHDLPLADCYLYLPYLKLESSIAKEAKLANMEVSDKITEGLLWLKGQNQVAYILDEAVLRELLVNLQAQKLKQLGFSEQIYEQASFNTWQLKELLKALKLYDLRTAYNLTQETISESQLLRSEQKSNESIQQSRENATAYLDLDVLAYSLGCLKTELYTDFLKRFNQAGEQAGPLITKLIFNTLHYLDLAYAQVAFSQTASLVFRIEQALVPVLAEMENNGILIDQNELNKAKEYYQTEMDKAERQLIFIAGHPLNLNSPEQVSAFLFDELNLRSNEQKVNKSGFISTRNENLIELAKRYPLVEMLLDYRKFQKLLNFAEGLQSACRKADSRVTTEYLQTKTATGRLSSQNPNLQNIPVRAEVKQGLREAFVAEPNRVLLDVDYSQIELRIMAALSNDAEMLKAFSDDRDIHTEVASHIFHKATSEITPAERSHAKAINFSLIYGATSFGTAKRLGISFGEAKLYLDNYFAKYAGIKSYMEYLQDMALSDDYVASVFSRRRYLGKLKAHQVPLSSAEFNNELIFLAKKMLSNLQSGKLDKNNSRVEKVSAADKRIIINTPIQGTGADIIKLAMLKTVLALRRNNYDAKLLLQVHDELLFSVSENEVDEVKALVEECMENIVDLGVKLEVKAVYGQNWAEIH